MNLVYRYTPMGIVYELKDVGLIKKLILKSQMIKSKMKCTRLGNEMKFCPAAPSHYSELIMILIDLDFTVFPTNDG